MLSLIHCRLDSIKFKIILYMRKHCIKKKERNDRSKLRYIIITIGDSTYMYCGHLFKSNRAKEIRMGRKKNAFLQCHGKGNNSRLNGLYAAARWTTVLGSIKVSPHCHDNSFEFTCKQRWLTKKSARPLAGIYGRATNTHIQNIHYNKANILANDATTSQSTDRPTDCPTNWPANSSYVHLSVLCIFSIILYETSSHFVSL